MKGKPLLQISTFGRFTFHFGEREWQSFRGDKARGLLLYLALKNGVPQRRDHLCTLFWPEKDTAAGRNNLRVTLLNLRKSWQKLSGLPPESLFIVDRKTIQLREDVYECDVLTLQAALENLEGGKDKLAHLTALAEQVAGSFLPGFGLPDSSEFDDWLQLQGEQANRDKITLFEVLIDLHNGCGDAQRVIEMARHLLKLDAWRESTWQQLFAALASTGDLLGLEEAWERCQRVLLEDLGVAPSDMTRQIYEQSRKPRAQQVSSKGNLRPGMTTFLGRKGEHRSLVDLLTKDHVRFVTLLGAGGIGKSRLSVQVGKSLEASFPDGVWFVPLAGSQSSDFLTTIGDTLGINFHGATNRMQQLISVLEDKRTLLILDNFEDVLDKAMNLLDLLSGTTGLKLLCTSREMLNLSGEWVVQLDGLTLPAETLTVENVAENDSMQLFLQRARQINNRFTLDSTNMEAVAGICRYVGGSPLGIELAAAWMRGQSPAQLLSTMRKSPDILESKHRDLPERQRSVRTIFNYSWNGLGSRPRQVLTALALFKSGFSAEQAEIVAQCSHFDLFELVDKSLLKVQDDVYQMHSLVRYFSAEKQAPDSPAPSIFSKHFLNWIANKQAALKGADGGTTAIECSKQYENLMRAWDIAVKTVDIASLNAAYAAFIAFWILRGLYDDGIVMLEQTLDQLNRFPEAASLRSKLYAHLSELLLHADRYDEAVKAANAAHSSDEMQAYGWGLLHEGVARWQLGQRTTAFPLYEKALLAFEANDEKEGMARVLNEMGVAATITREDELAYQRLTRALSLSRQTGTAWVESAVLIRMCILAKQTGADDDCRRWGEQALDLCSRTGDLRMMSSALIALADFTIEDGRLPVAEQLLFRAENINRQLDLSLNSMFSNLFLGLVYEESGRISDAVQAFEYALARSQQLGHQWWECRMLVELGRLALEQGRAGTGIQLVRRGQEIAQAVHHESVQATAERLLDEFDARVAA